MLPIRNMNTNSHERVVKKVSRACNTCRLKRKKCDGLDPCAFCVDNKLECLYSKEPRRRGPPSGYLRYTETRVAVLETLLGLYLSRLPYYADKTNDPFLDSAKILQKESKTCTQDVWDAHKAIWSGCETAKVVEELVVSFAPFTPRPAQDVSAKTLLPPPSTIANADPSTSSQGEMRSFKEADEEEESSRQWPFTRASQSESFGKTHDRLSGVSATASPPLVKNAASDPGPSTISFLEQHEQHEWSGNHGQTLQASHPRASNSVPYPVQRSGNQDYENLSKQTSGMGVNPLTGLDMTYELKAPNQYTGSYWRTAELTQPEFDPYITQTPTTTSQPIATLFPAPDLIDLPPPHILSRLLDVYYEYSYASYPFLPGRDIVDAMVSSSNKTETTSLLILSLSAYCGRLSLTANSASSAMGGGLAGKIAADLWYERARTNLSDSLKKGISLELIQATLFLALRDYGKGNEPQAWILVGLAIRMSQSLHINEDSNTTKSSLKPVEELYLHRNVWGVCIVLDLLLSLQLRLPPVTPDALKVSYDTSPRLRSPQMEINPPPPFTYVVSLCRVISMIHFHLYLDYPSPSTLSPSEKLFLQLKTELDGWHQSLPMQYRIALEQQPRRDVIEINMLYYVAIILLYRPISREQLNQESTEIFLEAASTFNVLLDKYRLSHPNAPNPSNNGPALLHTNPNIIYLIYTVAIAHISGYKCRRLWQGSGSDLVAQTIVLQTQVHLLKCLEALASIGYTWELARRCWKALDSFMEKENLKPQGRETTPEGASATLGKRKREPTEDVQNRPWPVTDNADIGPSIQRNSFDQQSSASYGTESTPSTLTIPTPNPSRNLQYVPYPPIPDVSNLATSEWNTSVNAVCNMRTTLGLPSNTDIFDPSIFSMRWMPDASRPSTTEWFNTWDENLWSQNFMNNMGPF